MSEPEPSTRPTEPDPRYLTPLLRDVLLLSRALRDVVVMIEDVCTESPHPDDVVVLRVLDKVDELLGGVVVRLFVHRFEAFARARRQRPRNGWLS